MKTLYKKTLALTDQGAKDLVQATLASFWVYGFTMLPVMILLILLDEFVFNHVKNHGVLILLMLITLVGMYWLLDREYNHLYNGTYKESANLRTQIAEELSRLPLSYFSKHHVSDVSQTIMVDIEGIEHAMSHAIPKSAGLALFLPILSACLLVGNYKLGLAVIVPAVLSFLFILLSKKKQLSLNHKYYHTLRENSEAFQESIERQQEIKSFHLTKTVKEMLVKKLEASEKIQSSVEFRTFYIMALSTVFSYSGVAIVMLVGGQLLLSGEVRVLYVIGYLLAAIKVKEAFDTIKEGVLELFYLSPKIQRIKEIKETTLQEGAITEFQRFDIELQHVFFSYDEGLPVLIDTSFVAKQGEVTALVGASGCGKTSVLKVIARLYDYEAGRIMIGGHTINQVATSSLFHQVAIVFQEVTLFNTSMMENIRIGKKEATDEEVKQAAKLANCHEFIEKLPEGYQTIIGENGRLLSGGERQRLSIARAFLKDAPILLLDEIAANLDIENEQRIQASLNQLIKNKTVLIVSHRLKSIEHVDKIVVMDQGTVVNQGTHAELLQTSAIYQNLIKKMQLSETFVY